MSGPSPTVESPTTMMVVNTWGEDAVFYDLETFTETDRFELPPQPHEIRHDPKRGVVYCTFAYKDGYYFAHEEVSSEIAVIDPQEKQIVETFEVTPEVGPHGIDIDDERNVMWLSCETGNGTVIAVDLDSHKVESSVAIGEGKGKPHWMIKSPDGKKIYTANRESPFVSVVDLDAGVLAKQIPLPEGSEDLDFSADGKKLFVSSMYAKKLHVIDTDSDEVIEDKELDDLPSRVTRTAQNKLLISHIHLPFHMEGKIEPGRLSVLDADTLEVETAIDVGRVPIDQTVNADGSKAYVANAQGGTVFEISLEESVEVRRAVETGTKGYAPHGILLL